jgi:hypothetical protein
MIELFNNTKKKKKDKWFEDGVKRVVDSVSEDDKGKDTNASGKPICFSNGAPMSIVGSDGCAMAHCVMLDDEPDTESQEAMTQFEECGTGYWKLIRISTVCRGWAGTVLPPDAVFDRELDALPVSHRSLGALCQKFKDNGDGGGFHIWHEYCVRRLLPGKKETPAKRKNKNGE